MHELQKLVLQQKNGEKKGICSVCSSSPFVLDAALQQAKETGTAVLIEATANQVNQFGGYTGMTPGDFREAMLARARALGFPLQRLILGGDHLGPVAWQKEPAAEAMEKGRVLVRDFAGAGYTKIHLDASMPLADDGLLTTEEIARRTALLCQAAEEGFESYAAENPDAEQPVYVIGSEVPTPGGSGQAEELSLTRPEDLTEMLRIFQEAFAERHLQEAWGRVVAAVVQPGVEFGNDSIHEYVPEAAAALVETAKRLPGIVLEGHSTDYQPLGCLRRMVEDGIAILKVGPALTYAAREALFGLSYMERELDLPDPSRFMEVLEETMLASPENWERHYPREEPLAKQMRKFSYSDRSRYYMTQPQVTDAIEKLLHNLQQAALPLPMLRQFLPEQYQHIGQGILENEPRAIVLDHVRDTLREYWTACGLT